MAYSPKTLRPSHLHMIRMHHQGESNIAIADATGYTPQQVSNILNSPEAIAILDALAQDTIDSMAQVQSEAQLLAPVMMDELAKDALSSPDQKVRLQAKIAWLGIAGHSVRGTVVQRDESKTLKRYEGKTEAELQAMLREDLTNKPHTPADTGPDGKPLQ